MSVFLKGSAVSVLDGGLNRALQNLSTEPVIDPK
jgi:hypothetical protein